MQSEIEEISFDEAVDRMCNPRKDAYTYEQKTSVAIPRALLQMVSPENISLFTPDLIDAIESERGVSPFGLEMLDVFIGILGVKPDAATPAHVKRLRFALPLYERSLGRWQDSFGSKREYDHWVEECDSIIRPLVQKMVSILDLIPERTKLRADFGEHRGNMLAGLPRPIRRVAVGVATPINGLVKAYCREFLGY